MEICCAYFKCFIIYDDIKKNVEFIIKKIFKFKRIEKNPLINVKMNKRNLPLVHFWKCLQKQCAAVIIHLSIRTIYIKGVTMRAIFSNSVMIENKILKKKIFPAKICFGNVLFQPLV